MRIALPTYATWKPSTSACAAGPDDDSRGEGEEREASTTSLAGASEPGGVPAAACDPTIRTAAARPLRGASRLAFTDDLLVKSCG